MSGAAPSSELAASGEDVRGLRTDPASELALIAGALERMAQALREDRGALERLGTMLSEMAETVAKAKSGNATSQPMDTAVLLDEFEHRIDAMIEIATGKAAVRTQQPENTEAEGPGENDAVPTVSAVVSELVPDHSDVQSGELHSETTETLAADKGPTVAMLTAMVEALRESIVESVVEPVPQAEAQSAIETVLSADPVTVELPATESGQTAIADERESALLASLERMEARPIPPPDEGTVVIFEPRETPERAASETSPAAGANETGFVDATAEVVEEPIAAPPEAFLGATNPESDPSAVPEAAAAETVEPDFDPSEFLFGPEPEADPATIPKSAAPLYQEIIARPPTAPSAESDSGDALPHEVTQAGDSNHNERAEETAASQEHGFQERGFVEESAASPPVNVIEANALAHDGSLQETDAARRETVAEATVVAHEADFTPHDESVVEPEPVTHDPGVAEANAIAIDGGMAETRAVADEVNDSAENVETAALSESVSPAETSVQPEPDIEPEPAAPPEHAAAPPEEPEPEQPYDPLHALKAMSESERIALFS